MRFFWWWLPNILLLIDWGRNRRDVVWFFVLACFGPIGALAYLAYFWESITFPFPIARTLRQLTGKRVSKRCHRCQQLADEVAWVEDGRTRHLMCLNCAVEVKSARG